MDRLLTLVGKERPLGEVAQVLSFSPNGLQPSVTGAVLVTCADESEHECAQAFIQGFVAHRLPALKSAVRSPMRLANLGARYEWGTVRIAEAHFRDRPVAPVDKPKLMMVKINAHVARSGRAAEDPLYGVWKRYGTLSPGCGALDALLQGDRRPHAMELAEAFGSEGVDRLALLRDPATIPPRRRMLDAAVVSARLQARKAVLDIQDHDPERHTRYLVVPCVTINQPGADTEIVVGVYDLDHGDDSNHETYHGLGDDPSAYRFTVEHGRVEVSDPHVGRLRAARNHRVVAREEAGKLRSPGRNAALDDAGAEVRAGDHRRDARARTLLRIVLPILAELAPVPAAIVLFAGGAVDIHHAFKVHRLARRLAGDDEARQLLADVEAQLDSMGPERAQALLELLFRDLGP